jgi:hypothetical protein
MLLLGQLEHCSSNPVSSIFGVEPLNHCSHPFLECLQNSVTRILSSITIWNTLQNCKLCQPIRLVDASTQRAYNFHVEGKVTNVKTG